MSQESPSTPPPLPRRPHQPNNVLDSIFQAGGPMPPAKLWLRILALTLDMALMLGISFIICSRYTLPQEYPDAVQHWQEYEAAAHLWVENQGFQQKIPPPQPSDYLLEVYQHCFETLFFCTWMYFAFSESFFRGLSLGKRTCRIRTISCQTLAPSIFNGIVRGGTKTMVLLFVPFNLLMIPATLIALRFNKRNQMGHDLLNRTVVVDETAIMQQHSGQNA